MIIELSAKERHYIVWALESELGTLNFLRGFNSTVDDKENFIKTLILKIKNEKVW